MELNPIEFTLLASCLGVDPLALMQVNSATKKVEGLTPRQLALFKARGELQVAGIAVALMAICPVDHDMRQPFLEERFREGAVSQTRQGKVRDAAKVILSNIALMLDLGLDKDRALALHASLPAKALPRRHAKSSPSLQGGEMHPEC